MPQIDVEELVRRARGDQEACAQLMSALDQVQACATRLRAAHAARASLAQLPPELLKQALEARG